MNIRTIRLLAIALVAASLSGAFQAKAQASVSPDTTCLFANKDGQNLYLDVYLPTEGSLTSICKPAKPTVIFVFGGGFVNGERNSEGYLPWFKMLNDEGYGVISIDYRLGMKGVRTKGGIGSVKSFYKAVTMASEDLFSATAFIIDNADELGVDPNNLVISGSSAGAMTVLEADWMLCNGKETVDLPDDFRYAGVMSFAGAILSKDGMPDYKRSPAPTALFHGTADKIVEYKKIHVFNWAFVGSGELARIFKKNGYPYNIFRYEDHSHEIAGSMIQVFPETLRFLETNVVKGEARSIDALIDDPAISKPHGSGNRKELYGED